MFDQTRYLHHSYLYFFLFCCTLLTSEGPLQLGNKSLKAVLILKSGVLIVFIIASVLSSVTYISPRLYHNPRGLLIFIWYVQQLSASELRYTSYFYNSNNTNYLKTHSKLLTHTCQNCFSNFSAWQNSTAKPLTRF